MAIRAYQPPISARGHRLDAVLSGIDSDYSRSSWQKLIKDARVRVDSQTVRDPSAKYTKGLIEFDPPETILAPDNVVPVLYEDDDVIVFDKPAGVLTHAKGQLSSEWTLADVARPKVKDDDTNRPGIVHRLDRDTSGVIIVAKHAEAKRFLQSQFAKRRVKKAYIALLEGQVKPETLTMDWSLARHPAKPSTWTTNPNGKPASTQLRVERRLKDATLVDLTPLTGRTHQLRVHCAKLGHPIIGDRLYGHESERLMLHARSLELVMPNGEVKRFEAEPPEDFVKGISNYEQ